MKEKLRKLSASTLSIFSLSGIVTGLGVNNISQINMTNVSTGNATGVGLKEFSKDAGRVFAGEIAGSTQLGGLLFLLMMGFSAYKLDIGLDTSAAIMIPSVFFLASQGLLPYGQGIVYGGILVVAALAIFGVIKFADR